MNLVSFLNGFWENFKITLSYPSIFCHNSAQGFLDDRKNIDAMEHLEAAHMGVDSTEKVTVQSVVEHLLGGRSEMHQRAF